jgi:hypothetical protein
MTDAPGGYPPEAYAPSGELWWELETWPGTRRPFGDERKIAAWLAFHVDEGDTFTMRDLRNALGDELIPNDAEHLNRRLRALRPDGWLVPTNKDDRTLPVGVYRLDQKGWHPGLGARPRKQLVSQGMRRRILDRDGRRCVVCGVGEGEPYPNEPGTRAVLTVGHRLPQEMGGRSDDPNNLQAECKRCNEPVRQEMGIPESLDDVLLDVRRLKKDELRRLLAWMQTGHRTRDRLDSVYDRARALSAGEREQLVGRLRLMLGLSSPE